jgi:hypothetical protein
VRNDHIVYYEWVGRFVGQKGLSGLCSGVTSLDFSEAG